MKRFEVSGDNLRLLKTTRWQLIFPMAAYPQGLWRCGYPI